MERMDSSNHRPSTLGEDLRWHGESAEQSGDRKKQGEIRATRSKLSAIGFNPDNIVYADEVKGGKTVLGYWKPSTGETGMAGYETAQATADRVGIGVSEVYEQIGKHEKLHAEIDAADSNGLFDAFAEATFGRGSARILEEGMVSEATSKEIDGYNVERSTASLLLSGIRVTMTEVLSVRRKGGEALQNFIWRNAAANSVDYSQDLLQKTG